MKSTAFHFIHQQLGAKIIEFGGYAMPVHYSGIIEEHKCVRTAVGMFDVSHMGEVYIKGKDARAFVQYLTTNDVGKLSTGKAQYSAMCYVDAGIVDDLLVYSLGSEFMLVINAANRSKDIEWMKANSSGFDIEIQDRSDNISLLAVQGPQALATLRKLTTVNLAGIPYYSFVQSKLANTDMIISRTGYTGEMGFELYFDSSEKIGFHVWNAIMESGKEFGIKPIGLGARDTLRLEMGYCLYGNDIDQTTNVLEAGLGWITKLDKGNFIGRDTLFKVKERGIERKLVGFIMEDDKSFPRHGYEIRSQENSIGTVTSGTRSPVLEKGIGLGYIRNGHLDETISIIIREKPFPARITKLPFIKKK